MALSIFWEITFKLDGDYTSYGKCKYFYGMDSNQR